MANVARCMGARTRPVHFPIASPTKNLKKAGHRDVEEGVKCSSHDKKKLVTFCERSRLTIASKWPWLSEDLFI